MQILLTDEMDTSFGLDYFHKITTAIIDELAIEIDEKVELSLLLTDDETIHELNREYRQKDRATDVLSFEMDDEIMLGDIVISIDTATRQANDVDILLERELAFLYIHGFLHLLGYDHETSPEDEKEMFEIQERILKSLIDKGLIL